MKNALKLMVLAGIFVTGCSKPSQDNQRISDSLKTAHQALYNETMDIHDEVMPKMDNLYSLKKSLQDSLAKTPKLSAEGKAAIERRVQQIDSAGNAMMVWMRQFNPSDSVASPAYGAYMQQELEKVKKVRAAMLNVLTK
jgi:hypothetical protein